MTIEDFKQIIELIELKIASGDWPFFIIAVMVLIAMIIWRGRGIIEFFLQIQRLREKWLLKSLKIQEISGMTKVLLVDEINILIFRKLTKLPVKLSANKSFRDKFFGLCEKSGGELHPHIFGQIRNHVEFNQTEKRIQINFNRYAKTDYILNASFAVMFFGCGVFTVAFGVYLIKTSVLQSAGLTSIGIAYALFGILMAAQNKSYVLAKKIKPRIDELQEDGHIADRSQ
jgi:hypothetical protein